jgi:hypothetical protein
MSFSDFSSWPRDQEQSLVPFEQHVTESQSKAWTISGIVAGVFLVFALGVYFGVAPKHNNPMKDTDMSNLTKKKSDAPAAEAPAAEKK